MRALSVTLLGTAIYQITAWRRHKFPCVRLPRGGSGYEFTYDDDETNHAHRQQPQSQQYLPPELPPDLPDYGNDPYNSGSQNLNDNNNAPPLPTVAGYPYDGRNRPPPPPNLPDRFNNEPFPSAELDLQQDEPEPWDTTYRSSAHQDSMVDDLSAFDKQLILRGLAKLYRKKILPLELSSKYGQFHSPPLSPADFDAPPMILLLGQYSVGKTSFVKYLLGRDFPGIRVGPEPTTDRFHAILWGAQDKVVPGAALASQMDRPFTGLSPFGNNFLSRLEASELDSPILKNVTIIDTPGILSGQKQRSRNYDYEAVMKWFAERADLIIVMFDAHKLDISDELKDVMQLMIPHLDKVRIVLNKADSIGTQQLMRVYGALMWSLGKVMNTPEVSRVYIGSFWDAPLQNTEQQELLQREEMDLLHDIMTLPQHAVMRRINELVKRARSVKVHAYIIHYLRKQLPYNPFKKKDKQRKLIGRLESEFLGAARRYGLPKGDFPSLEPMRRALYEIKDLAEFPKLDKKMIREMDKVFSSDIPELLEKAKHH